MRSYLDKDGVLHVEKKNWTHPFTRISSGDGGGSGPKLEAPYRNSVWVQRAVKYVVDPIATVPVVFSVDRRGGDVAFEDVALTRFMERPARAKGGLMNRSAFIQATGGWRKLAGEAFWILDDTWLSASSVKSPIVLARPGDMKEVVSTDGELVGWRWRRSRGQEELLIPEQVKQIKGWNPYNDFRGLAEWEAAKVAADSDYAAGLFARNLMANNGDRGPYVVGKDGAASPEQIEQITAQLRQKREMSRRGDFRPVFLTGDIEVQEPGLQAVDAAYVAQRLENRHEIFLAFGVPPSFADVTASYSVGSASDRFKLIEEACMPLAEEISDALEEVAAMFLGGGRETIFAAFDFDEHSTMQQVRGERFESATKAVDRGVPWQVAADYFRLRMPRFAGDEVGRVPFNLQEIGGDEPAEDPPASDPSEEPGEDPAAVLQEAFKARTAAIVTRDNDERAALWSRIHGQRRPWEKRMEKRIGRHLFEARRETLANIETAKKLEEKTATLKASPSDLVFELGGWLADWVKGLLMVDQSAIEQAGLELWTEELGKDDPMTMPAAEVQSALAERENRIKDAGERVWRKIHDEIQEALLEGDSMDEIAGRVKKSFKGIQDGRAKAIATTETTVAYETGRDLAMKSAGVEWTEWVSAQDERVRHTHRDADGQVREMGDPFLVNGHEMAFPGDPEAPAEEVINCRCVRIAKSGPDTGDIVGNDDDGEVPL